jgi:SEC-C motif
MKVGRNDPCPCGSGKKYKKCCLAKDEAAARQDYAQHATTRREVAGAFDLLPLPEPPPPPPPDPRTQARNELWEAFDAADAQEQPVLFRRALAEPDVLDAELAFEMICAIRDNHDRAVFADALDMLHEQRPELYEHDAPYYLDWRIVDALATGNLAALLGLGAAIAETAGKDLDTFYIALDRLAYHGQSALAAQMMAQAWPHIGEGQDLVSCAPEEFAQRAMDLTLFAHLEQDPQLRPDDPQLLTALEVFAPADRERLAVHVALLRGQDKRRWSLDDFAFRRPAKHEWYDEDEEEEPGDPAAQRLDDLSLMFLGTVYREQGVSLAKGDLARESIARYILERHAGELQPSDLPFGRRPKGRKTASVVRRAPVNQLCPDRATLDHFLAGMLNIISPQYYEAAATLELIPAWLRFLEGCGLLATEQRAAALDDLSKLVSDAAPIWEQSTADPTVGPNIRSAWEQS